MENNKKSGKSKSWLLLAIILIITGVIMYFGGWFFEGDELGLNPINFEHQLSGRLAVSIIGGLIAVIGVVMLILLVIKLICTAIIRRIKHGR